MNLMNLYDQISDPLNNEKNIDRLIGIYGVSLSGQISFYSQLVEPYNKRTYPSNVYKKDKDDFYVYMFNVWKNNILNMRKDEYDELHAKGFVHEDFVVLRNYLKNIGDFQTKDQIDSFVNMNKNNSMLNTAFDNYYWSNVNKNTSWTYVYSNLVNYNKIPMQSIEHRLYINSESVDTFKIARLFVEKCIKNNLPYNYKFDERGNREDTMVVYSSTENLLKYCDILEEIKRENLNTLTHIKEPPFLSGNINGWLGYGSENIGNHEESYNSMRGKMIEESITTSIFNWIKNNKNARMFYLGKYYRIDEFLTIKAVEKMTNNFEFSKIKSTIINKKLYNILYPKICSCLPRIVNKDFSGFDTTTLNIEGVNTSFSASDMEKIIKKSIDNILEVNPDFKSAILLEINRNCYQHGIDQKKFCFGVKNIKLMEEYDKKQDEGLKQNTDRKQINPVLYPNYDFSFGGLKNSYDDYLLKKDSEGKLYAITKKSDIPIVDPLVIKRLKFAISWFKSTMTNRKRNVSSPFVYDSNDYSYAFGNEARQVYNELMTKLQSCVANGNQLSKTLLERLKMPNKMNFNNIVSGFQSNDAYVKALDDWVSLTMPFVNDKQQSMSQSEETTNRKFL